MKARRSAGHPSRASRAIHKLSAPVVLFWLAVAVLVNVVAPQLQVVAKERSVALGPQDAPSLIAMKRIGKVFEQFDSDTTAMVLIEGKDKLGDSAHRFYDTLIAKLSQDNAHIEHIDDFWSDPLTAGGSQSTDGKAAYVQLYLAGAIGDWRANESVAAVQRIVESVPPPPGLKAYLTGQGPLAADRIRYVDRSMEKITGISTAVIAIMLLFTYRSILTAVFILLAVGIELLAARGAIAVLGLHHLISLSTFTVNILVALTIAAATDYIIFFVGRYQEALAAGQDRKTAYHNMFSGTVHVVLASGLTVAGAMYCLSFTRLPCFNTLAAPCSIALIVVVGASLTLAPAVVALASRFGVFDPRQSVTTRRWRRIGTVVVRWPGPVLVAATLVALIGLLALPKYQTSYNERHYIPGEAPANIGYRVADRYFTQARMEPEVLMIEADHDLRNTTDLFLLEKIAKGIFHLPGIARVQGITRPLGSPTEHSSIPFQISVQSAMTIENIQDLRERVTDLSTLSDQLQRMIDITQHTQDLTRELTGATHDMNTHTKQMRADADELRDQIADFDDFWRPIRNLTHWERHCYDIPVCWQLRSLMDSMDSVDKLSEDLANVAGDTDQIDAVQRELLAQLPLMISTMQAVKKIAQTLTSAFSGLVTQMEDMTRNATTMGKTFDAARSDDLFYLPPEVFDNPDFQRGLELFLSPNGKAARFIITHKGDPASAEGISHLQPIMLAAEEAVKGTPLQTAGIYLAGTASAFKDIHEGSTYDLMIAAVASLCLIFIIMLGVTRSVVASAVIVGTVAFSLGSAFGLSVLIWQHILHMPLHWLVMPMAIIVMLAVGSDYNLLLVARFREEVGAGLRTGMIRSMASTGKVVTTAGLVFAFTMGSMATSDLRVIAQTGTTIMIGLLFDTLVVRSFVMPAIATLLGRWFWWPRQGTADHADSGISRNGSPG